MKYLEIEISQTKAHICNNSKHTYKVAIEEGDDIDKCIEEVTKKLTYYADRDVAVFKEELKNSFAETKEMKRLNLLKTQEEQEAIKLKKAEKKAAEQKAREELKSQSIKKIILKNKS
jgi:hypothetical protein